MPSYEYNMNWYPLSEHKRYEHRRYGTAPVWYGARASGPGRPRKTNRARRGQFIDIGFHKGERGVLNGMVVHSRQQTKRFQDSITIDAGVFDDAEPYPRRGTKPAFIAYLMEYGFYHYKASTRPAQGGEEGDKYGRVPQQHVFVPPRPFMRRARSDLDRTSKRVLTSHWRKSLVRQMRMMGPNPESVLERWEPGSTGKRPPRRTLDPLEALEDRRVANEWGNALVDVLRNSIMTMTRPPLEDSTVQRKAKSKRTKAPPNALLRETNHLIDSIDFKITKGLRKVRNRGNIGASGKTKFA